MTGDRPPRRATRPAGPPRRALRRDAQPPAQPGVCRCKPIPVAHYRGGDLHALYRRHWGSRDGQPGCGMPDEPIDPRTYYGARR